MRVKCLCVRKSRLCAAHDVNVVGSGVDRSIERRVRAIEGDAIERYDHLVCASDERTSVRRWMDECVGTLTEVSLPSQVFSSQGHFKQSLRLKELSQGGGGLRYPMGIAVDGSGTVAFVADTHNHR
jgi:hypothetical protein